MKNNTLVEDFHHKRVERTSFIKIRATGRKKTAAPGKAWLF